MEVRYIDDLGRIVLPRDVRRVMDVSEGSELEISTRSHGNGVEIVLAKVGSAAARIAELEAEVIALRREVEVLTCGR